MEKELLRRLKKTLQMSNKSTSVNFKKQILALAPLDGYTDCAFREVVKKYGNPDFMFTEFVNCQGLIKAPEKLIDTLRYTEFQRPIIAQLFGKEPEYFYKASLLICQLGYDGIDINMGCPAKNVASKGGGAALIKNPRLALEIIKAVQKARSDYKNDRNGRNDRIERNDLRELISIVKRKVREWEVKVRRNRRITVSVKTRIGYDKDITEEWMETLSKAKVDFISLHARTFKQGFKGSADWDAIKRAVEITKKPIIGNGDVKSYNDCQRMIKQTGCFGVMIGRGAIGRPWIFNKSKVITHNSKRELEFIKKVALEHARLYVKFKGEKKFYEMRKHLMAYFTGFKGAKALRKQVATVNKLKELVECVLPNA